MAILKKTQLIQIFLKRERLIQGYFTDYINGLGGLRYCHGIT
jgi:hypothetical protein